MADSHIAALIWTVDALALASIVLAHDLRRAWPRVRSILKGTDNGR